MSVCRVIVNNLCLENFDTIFIENEKSYQNINFFFLLFSLKLFLNEWLTITLRTLISITPLVEVIFLIRRTHYKKMLS